MVLLYRWVVFGAIFSLVETSDFFPAFYVNSAKCKEIVNKNLQTFLVNVLFAFLALIVAFLT